MSENLRKIVRIKNIFQVGFIQFIILLDNNAKRIYAKYMQKDDNYLSQIENQKELEQKITSTVLSMNVNKNNESKIDFYH